MTSDRDLRDKFSDELEYADVVSGFTDMENSIGRTVQPLLVSGGEFKQLIEEGNEAITAILQQPRAMLKGQLS